MTDVYVYPVTIPSAPNWYEPSIMVYAPNDMLIYGARADIVIIKHIHTSDLTPKVQIIRRAHGSRVNSLAINKKWGEPNMYLITTGEDKVVKLWDLESNKEKASHNKHGTHKKIIGAEFAGEDKVVSVSEEGVVILWNIHNKMVTHLSGLFSFKASVTCLSVCPHLSWLASFGLKNGLVLVCDLRQTGTVLYKLRGHERECIGLAWCPAPVNIFPKNPNNIVGPKWSISDEVTFESQEETVKITNLVEIPHSSSVPEMTTKQAKPTVRETKSTTSVVDGKDFLVHSDSKMEESNNKVPESEIKTEHSELTISGESDLEYEDSDTVLNSSDEEICCPEDFDTLKVYDSKKMDFQDNSNTKVEGSEAVLVSDKKTSEAETKDEGVGTALKVSPKEESQVENTRTVLTGEVKKHKGSKEQPKLSQGQRRWDRKHRKEDKYSATKLRLSQAEASTAQTLEPKKTTSITLEPKTSTIDLKQDQVSLPSMEEPHHISVDVADGLQERLDADINPPLRAKDEVTIEVLHLQKRPPEPEKNVQDESVVVLKSCATETSICHRCSNSSDDCVCHDIIEVHQEVEQPSREYLLVSVAKESSIYIWRAGTDGRMQTFLTLPAKKSKRDKSKDKIWVSVCWPTPTKLYISSKNNELVQWTLPKTRGESWKIVHEDHSAFLFTIASSMKICDQNNWNRSFDHVVWTTGQDRQLIAYHVGETICKIAHYPAFGGYPECMVPSKRNPYRIAIGTGCGSLRIWDLTNSTDRIITMSSFYQKIQSRVTSLSWHPTNENIIAFATAEGRSGYFDLKCKSKLPKLVPHYFTKEIHKVQWGPVKSTSEPFGIYMNSEGRLAYHDLSDAERTPTLMNISGDEFVYNFAWKLDYSCLLISLMSGTLLTYSADLIETNSLICTHKFGLLTWNPHSFAMDTSTHTWCQIYAATMQGKHMLVLDHSRDTKNFEEKIIGRYNCPKDYINTLAWSNYGTKIAIGTDHGFILVWDLPTKTIMWSYVHDTYQGITSVMFSPLGTEHVFCGTKDNFVRVFRQCEHPPMTKSMMCATREIIFDLRKEESRKVKEEVLQKVGKDDDKPTKGKTLLPLFHNTRKTPQQFLSDARRLLTFVEEHVKEEPATENRADVDIVDVFGSQESMFGILDRNEQFHKNKGKVLGIPLALFKGDIGDYIKEAIEQNRVTPGIISLAPMVSIKLWQKACEVYADQLLDLPESDPVETATYYLACHKVHEAINALCKGAKFKEALALAKCRFEENSEYVLNVIEKWGNFAVVNGNFETAAECFIYLKKYDQAATALFKRTEPEVLLFAADLAERCKDQDLHHAALYRYQKFADQGEKSKASLANMKTIADLLLERQRKKNEQDAIPALQLPDENNYDAVHSSSTTDLGSTTSSDNFISSGAVESKIEVSSQENVSVTGEDVLEAIRFKVREEACEFWTDDTSSEDNVSRELGVMENLGITKENKYESDAPPEDVPNEENKEN